MANIIDLDRAIFDIVNTPSKVMENIEFDAKIFTLLVDRQNEIIDILKRQPITNEKENSK